VHELADDRGRQDRVDDEVEARPLGEMEEVALRSRREIVECENLGA
jgi:hypothetical protein